MIGERVLNYKIEALLGEGGVGSVYLATHSQLGRKVAIKVLNPSLVNNVEVRERFRNEAATLSSLQHINIVTLYDYLEDERGLFLIMEYVSGNSLDNYIRQVSGPIPEQKAIYFFNQILDGLSYAHLRGIVHRDIKPSNIIITSDADAKILDFGIAKILKEGKAGMTKTGARLGTVLFMSPEQVKGQGVDLRTDIYSLGITLFEMLTGRCPYDENSVEFEIYNKIVLEPLPRAKSFYPMVSDKMQAIIDKATAKNPAERFQSCEEFKLALNGTGTITYNFNPQATNPQLGQTNSSNYLTSVQTPTETVKAENNSQTTVNQPIIKKQIEKSRERNYTFLYVLLSIMLVVCGYLIFQEMYQPAQNVEQKVEASTEDDVVNEERPRTDELDKEPEKTPEEIALDTLEESKEKTQKLIDLLKKDRKAELLKGLVADAQLANDEVDLELRISVINKLAEVKFKDIVVAINFYNDKGDLIKTIEQGIEDMKGGESITFKKTYPNTDVKYDAKIKSAEPFDFEVPPSLDSLSKELEKIDEKILEIKEKTERKKSDL
jgi:serine/threonine protein kinase